MKADQIITYKDALCNNNTHRRLPTRFGALGSNLYDSACDEFLKSDYFCWANELDQQANMMIEFESCENELRIQMHMDELKPEYQPLFLRELETRLDLAPHSLNAHALEKNAMSIDVWKSSLQSMSSQIKVEVDSPSENIVQLLIGVMRQRAP